MKSKIKFYTLRTAAMAFAVLPPFFAVISYFPVWRTKGDGSLLSGAALILLILSAVPLFKFLKRLIKSPTALGIWFSVFVLFFMLEKIAEQMCVIAFVGFSGNLISSLLWRMGGRYE